MNLIKKMPGRVDTLTHISKKLNKRPQDRKNVIFGAFLFPVISSILTVCNFLKNSPDYNNPSGNFFFFYEILCSSNLYKLFYSLVEKLKIFAMCLNQSSKFFQWTFLWYLSTSFISKKFKYRNQENFENVLVRF